MKRIALTSLDALLARIAETQALYVPVDAKGGARFEQWEAGKVLSDATNTARSAKDFFFPQTESLYDVKMTGKKLEIVDTREDGEDFVIFGARACDVRSFSILDSVFLADPVDTYYKSRRDRATVVSLACTKPEETCFCQAFGIDAAAPEGDVAAWKEEGYLYLKAQSEKGERLLEALSDLLEDADEKAVETQQMRTRWFLSALPLGKVSFEGMKQTDLMDHFKNEKWKSLSEACIGCGTCTFVCPTCQCYDVREFDDGKKIRKFRCWDSCMYSDFTLMAHGNSRNSQLERFRQRFMHKLVYHPNNHDGEFGCVGCGRCLQKCPIGMNIVKVEKALEAPHEE